MADVREDLGRLADAAPQPAYDADALWRAGQGLRRRRRVSVAAAVVGSVALVASVVVGTSTLVSEPPVAGQVRDDDRAGVPSLLVGPPERIELDRPEGASISAEALRTDTLTLGRAAAAFTGYYGMPVVVDAITGEHRLPLLPDWTGDTSFLSSITEARGLALSPDGWSLAYAYAEIGPDAATAPIPSGVRVVDLRTGAIREIPLPGREGTLVQRLMWSPGSRWLAWVGTEFGSWTATSFGQGRARLGVIAPGATVSQRIEVPRPYEWVPGVSDDGEVTLASDTGVRTWADGELGAVTALPERGSYGEPALAVRRNGSDAVQLRPATGGAGVELWAGAAALGSASLTLPEEPSALAQVAGWVDDRTPLVVEFNSASVRALRFDRDGESVEVLRLSGPGQVQALTLATDLIGPDLVTLERPRHRWPWSDEQRWGAGLAVTGGAALLGWLAWRFRRRRNAPYLDADSARHAG